MNSIPRILYKYFGPDRIDIFEKGLIRYSPLGAFNDPFEGRPDITSLVTPENKNKVLDDAHFLLRIVEEIH